MRTGKSGWPENDSWLDFASRHACLCFCQTRSDYPLVVSEGGMVAFVKGVSMRTLRNVLFGFILLMIFTTVLHRYGVGLFNDIFDLAEGDANVLAFGFCIVLVLVFAGCWVWSSKRAP